MELGRINFGEIDAKNELLKQKRKGASEFFESYSLPEKVNLNDLLSGSKYFFLGLKGTGKTALLSYLNRKCEELGAVSEIILFKSGVSEEERQRLSKSSGFDIVVSDQGNTFLQDFKEAWKWFIFQKLASVMHKAGFDCNNSQKLYALTGLSKGKIFSSLGVLFSKFTSGTVKISSDALPVAVELGLSLSGNGSNAGLSELNHACDVLLNDISFDKKVYLLFDELELFHISEEQFKRDRFILRDLIYAIAQINAASANNDRSIFLCAAIRSEVLRSVLQLGHEISRDVDDFGIRLDWSEGKADLDHPLMKLIRRKIAVSAKIKEEDVWRTFFPEKINNQKFFQFILNSTYFRPRDIVRLLRVARGFDENSRTFTTEHFDQTSLEYSTQTWTEITEELLAIYSSDEIEAIEKLFLGCSAQFFLSDLEERIMTRYKYDAVLTGLKDKHGLTKVLADLYRIGVIGNDFWSNGKHRNRWIFRGNSNLNDAERMAVHKSLRKHLTMIEMSEKRPGLKRRS